MDIKDDTNNSTLGFFPTLFIVIMSVFIYVFSFLYKFLIKKPAESIINWLIEPMVEALDNEYTGLLIIGIFLLEVLLTLIVPWFFGVWFGVGFLVYFLVFFSFVLFVLNEDTNSKLHVSIFLTLSLPYLILLFFPTLSIVIFSKKPEKEKTLLETRIIKLKRIKRKVKRNRLKFWKK